MPSCLVDGFRDGRGDTKDWGFAEASTHGGPGKMERTVRTLALDCAEPYRLTGCGRGEKFGVGRVQGVLRLLRIFPRLLGQTIMVCVHGAVVCY